MPFISNLRTMEWLTVWKAFGKPIKTPQVYRLFSKDPGIWFADCRWHAMLNGQIKNRIVLKIYSFLLGHIGE